MSIGVCIVCNKKRKVQRVGGYIFRAKEYPILACQWCRAAATRRRNAKLPEPFLDRKEGK